MIFRCTGCPDQIGRNFKITLLHNQKTCRIDRGKQVGLSVFYGIHIIRLGIFGLKMVHLAIWETMWELEG
jgi:hypothetical protein